MMFRKSKNPKREIIINAESLETRVAILEDGKIEEFFAERPSDDRIVGSIFKGVIQNLESGLQAAFVDIGLKKNAFIHYWDMVPEDAARLEVEEGEEGEGSSSPKSARKKKFTPAEMAKKFPVGSELVVQVTKGAIGTKGPRVTASLSLPGRFLVMMPGTRLKGVSRKIEDAKERNRLKKILTRLPTPDGVGVIVRTVASSAKKTAFARDMRALTTMLEDIETGKREMSAPCRLYEEPSLIERMVRDSLTEDIGRIVIDSREEFDRIREGVTHIFKRSRGRIHLYDGHAPIFDHFDVERQLESALRRKVWLKSGGYLVFDETEALVSIDINTGRHKGGQNQEESITQVNLEAADEIARQLRLRNIGGLVVIDFIDMRSRRNQTSVFRALRDAMRHDKSRTNILPISQLGLLEMTRQRAEESISSSTFMDCPYCKGKGNVKSPLSMSVEIQRHIGEVLRSRKDQNEAFPLKISVNPAVMERLRTEDEATLVRLETELKGLLTFVSSSTLHVEEFVISNTDTEEDLYSNVERR